MKPQQNLVLVLKNLKTPGDRMGQAGILLDIPVKSKNESAQ